MGATAAGPVWARSNGFSLEARSATGARFELGEVESPSHTLKAAGFRIGRRPPPGQCPAAFPIGQGGEAHRRIGHNHDEMQGTRSEPTVFASSLPVSTGLQATAPPRHASNRQPGCYSVTLPW